MHTLPAPISRTASIELRSRPWRNQHHLLSERETGSPITRRRIDLSRRMTTVGAGCGETTGEKRSAGSVNTCKYVNTRPRPLLQQTARIRRFHSKAPRITILRPSCSLVRVLRACATNRVALGVTRSSRNALGSARRQSASGLHLTPSSRTST